MKVTYSWLIYSCLFFGSRILCDRKLERRQAVSYCSENTEDTFYCLNGMCILLSWVCDGRKDCSDGSDENNELCALYEYETNMTTNCGKVYKNNDELIDNGEESFVSLLPWMVGLYLITDNQFVYQTDGSIIGPNLVISNAQSFWIRNQPKYEGNYDKIKVAVVEYNNNFTVTRLSQVIDIEIIYPHEGFSGHNGFEADDISVIVLKKKILFSNGVAPVCIDWNGIYNVKNKDKGKIVLRDTEQPTLIPFLLETFLRYIDSNTCRNTYRGGFDLRVTFDKFCTHNKLVPGNRLYNGDIGTGISFLHDNSYYLTGLLSAINPIRYGAVLGFTDIKYHVKWIRQVINRHFTEKSCVLPTVEGVVYSYEGSNDSLAHGTFINKKRTVIENCKVGYHKAYHDGFRVCLGKGKWVSYSDTLCYKMCPALHSDSLDIKCTYNGVDANCSNESIPGTIAMPSCKPTYTAPKGPQEEAPLELHCQSNGMWNKPLYRCIPYCGRVYTHQVLIYLGEQAPVGTAPWNVGIYQFNKTNSNYDLICGGSIISPNLVVSAAHCFWKKNMLSKRINVDLYKIAVGKYNRNFTIIDNDFTQIVNVEMIHMNEGYNGAARFHADDIAIVVLQSRVSFSNGVAPVCIDWNGENNVVNGDHGKIVGWGRTEKGIPSPILLEASLPYIDLSTCRNLYTNGFDKFVTVDKFCAGSALGQGVDRGDSGGGLTFLHSNFYYLTGVVSIKDPETKYAIAVFTDVKYHMQWIRRLFYKHN